MRRLLPYVAVAPPVAGIGLALWLVTSLTPVRAITPFAILAAGVLGIGFGRHRPSGHADAVSLAGVGLTALAVFCLPFVTVWWGRIGFPTLGVAGMFLAAYGVGHRSDEGWSLTRDLGDEDEDEEYRPWLDDDPEWASREADGADLAGGSRSETETDADADPATETESNG